MSFLNPAVFATIKDAKQGEVYDITQIKNDKGYWDWTSVTKSTGAAASPPNGKVSAPATRSTYETPEERAARQVLIVRQSCLAQAVAHNNLVKDGVEGVLETADQFVDWVFTTGNVKTEELNDIPF